MRIAICPGSFDPVTLGHLDIIKRASEMFDEVIVAVLVNPLKNPVFTIDERKRLLKKVLTDINNVKIIGLDGLLVDYAKQYNAKFIVKGLRAVSDFEYEFQMALTNKKLYPDIETVFLVASEENMCLSSSVVKQVAYFGGDISGFVPKCILNDVKNKLFR